ncbi:hypothetical protein NPIL_184251, partial [Nephila pilipes]
MWAMKRLNLGGNPYLNVSSNTFSGTMPALTELSLNDNNFQDLDPYLLKSFRSLYKLCLNGNHISNIPRYFLSSTRRLKVLELADNELTSIEELFPVNQQHSLKNYVKTIRLDGNQLKSIRFGASAKSISHLDLSGNQIYDIGTHDLENLTSTITLNLAGNPLVNIDAGCFKKLIYLEKLNLSLIDIKQLNHSVQNIISLEELILDNSSLTSIGKDEFLGSNGLRMISLKNNSLKTVYGAMQNLTNLTSLVLSNNDLTTLTSDSLPCESNKVKLKSLWME